MALKLFMNVMYGYTGASFSGRMPCCDISDTVVETGRVILKNCMKYIVNIDRYFFLNCSGRKEGMESTCNLWGH